MNNKPICFITGNQNKLLEFQALVGELDFIHQSFDIPEIQGTPEEVALHKCKVAAQLYDGPVITDDVSLCFSAFNYKLPGPYIRDFVRSLGTEGLVKILSGFDDKKAYAQCTYGFCESKDAEPVLFSGQCHGQIVESRGTNLSQNSVCMSDSYKKLYTGFGYDPIFLADASGKRYSEMNLEDKNKISHRGLAAAKLLKFLSERQTK